MFWPTVQSKRVEIGKSFFFPRNLTLLAWWWPQKELDFGHSSPSYRASKSKVSKNGAKVPNLDADLRVGSCFGLLRGQNGSKSKKVFFPRKLTSLAWCWAQKLFHFGHSCPSYKPSKLPQNLPLSVHFGQVCTQWGIFFWHFSLLVPARATRGREIIQRAQHSSGPRHLTQK